MADSQTTPPAAFGGCRYPACSPGDPPACNHPGGCPAWHTPDEWRRRTAEGERMMDEARAERRQSPNADESPEPPSNEQTASP